MTSHTTSNTTSADHKPSLTDKIAGEGNRLVGKLTHDNAKVAKGTAQKGHPEGAEAVLLTGNTDVSEAKKQAASQHPSTTDAVPASTAAQHQYGTGSSPSSAHAAAAASPASAGSHPHSHVTHPHDEHVAPVGTGAKISGETTKLSGKAHGDPLEVAQGLEQKGHAEKAEAVRRTGETDASKAGKEVGIN